MYLGRLKTKKPKRLVCLKFNDISKKVINDYSNKTTVHGVHYISEEKSSLVERIWWAVVLVISIIICGMFIYNIWAKWNRNPVIVSFSSKTTAITDIPFPAVTICPTTNLQKSLINLTYVIEAIKTDNLSRTGLDPDTMDSLHEILYILCPRYRDLWETINTSNDYFGMEIVNILNVLAPPIEETILACGEDDFWLGICSHLFRRVLSDIGICYTFNGILPFDLYRENVIFSFSEMSINSTLPVTWTLENGYLDGALNPDAYPFNTIGGLFGKTFSFVLNVLKSNLIHECDSLQGFKLFLHSPNDVPLHTSHFIKVPLGNDVRISLMPKMTVTSKEIASYSPQQRNCFYNSERYLRLFKEYSETNCFVECVANYTIDYCDCVSFSTPRVSSTNICGLKKQECIKNALDAFHNESLLEISGVDKCDCKPACTSLSYDADTYYSPADGLRHIYDKLELENEELYESSIISILFKESEFIQIRRSELFGKTDLLANCGGILGLFLGISLISFAEIIYYCTLRPYFYIRQRRLKAMAQKNRILRKHSKYWKNKIFSVRHIPKTPPHRYF